MLSVNLGPLSLPVGYVLVLLALLVALVVGALVGYRDKAPITGIISDIFLIGMLSARIGFVLVYFEHYQDDLWGIIDIRDGGFNILVGVIGALSWTSYLIWRRPAIRRTLGLSIVSGFITFGTVMMAISLIETQANKVPEVQFSDLNGTSTSLSQIASGKPMVVNLWASWCPPCIREMPVLAEAQQRNPNITFVFVNQGEKAETINKFLIQNGLELRNLLTDTGGRLGRVTGSQALPTTLFYDASGRQVDAHIGELSRATLARSLSHFSSE
jgi:thiol-disulfide isomerase/thioredoxin